MVGYNIGHCLPGANTATWLDYSGINAARLFAAFSEWCPDELFDAGVGVTDVADFDARVDSLRADPQGTRFIQWPALLERFRAHVYENTNHYQLEFELTKLKDLGITPILEAAEPAWNRPWSGLWLQFQKHYAFTFYCASRFDVEHFNFLNEPDHPSVADDIVTQEIYVRGLQIASHAVHCAVEDVNTAFGKALSPKVQAPVITHVSQASGDYHMDADPDSDHRDDVHGWGEISLLNLRTDYHGATVEPDLFDIFDTHQYNHTAETFTDEIGMMKAKMQRYAPTGTALPIVYSEFNRRNTGAFETSRDSLDTPLVFSQLSEIWPAALTAGADGMICFKFDNTMRSNGIPYGTGCYLVENDGSYPIRGVTKAGEANRLFATRFAQRPGRQVLGTSVATSGPSVRPNVRISAVDRDTGVYSLWLPHDTAEAYPVELDLSALPSSVAGATVLVQEVSEAHSGDIVVVTAVPSSRKLTLVQPGACVWLISVLPGSRSQTVYPVLAAGLTPSHTDQQQLLVGQPGVKAEPSVSYLAFRVPADLQRAKLATLELVGGTSDREPLTFRVYAIADTAWTGRPLTWANAPHLDRTLFRARDTDPGVIPLGALTAAGPVGSAARLDVTKALTRSQSSTVGLLLVREQARVTDTSDAGRRASFAARGRDGARLQIWS